MTIHVTDVAIVGGGMVGGALALGLAQQGFTVTVLEKAAPPAFDPASAPDVRISAISAASVGLLKSLGVWDAIRAMRVHAYRRLETWEWESAHVAFDAAELKLPELGYMVENKVLQWGLWQALAANEAVTQMCIRDRHGRNDRTPVKIVHYLPPILPGRRTLRSTTYIISIITALMKT